MPAGSTGPHGRGGEGGSDQEEGEGEGGGDGEGGGGGLPHCPCEGQGFPQDGDLPLNLPLNLLLNLPWTNYNLRSMCLYVYIFKQ